MTRATRASRTPGSRAPATRARDALGVVAPLGLARPPRGARPAGPPPPTTAFCIALSIPSARPEHAGADVGHAGELEQPLDRAVLAERPVQAPGRRRRRRRASRPRARALDGPARPSAQARDDAVACVDLRHPPGLRRQRRRAGQDVPPPVAGDRRSAITSFVAGSSASITDRADRQLISCSDERPPNSTATRRRRAHAPPSLPVAPATGYAVAQVDRERREAVHQLLRARDDGVVLLERRRRRPSARSDPRLVTHTGRPGRERPGTGFLPHGRRSPAHHRDDRHPRGEREPDRAGLALHRQPVGAPRHRSLRVDHHDLARRERRSAHRARTGRRCRGRRGSGACPVIAHRSPGPGTAPPSRGSVVGGARGAPRTR